MSYTITITEKRSVPDRTNRWLQRKDKGDYDWVAPPDNSVTTDTRQVLQQEVETLDLSAVIKAINGL